MNPTQPRRHKEIISINRNILECKVRFTVGINRSFTVLIETYWNVKLAVAPLPVCAPEVLIETYWNVKIRLRSDPPDPRCINRNILECKDV